MIRLQKNDEIDIAQWEILAHESETSTWFQTPSAFLFYKKTNELYDPFAFAIEVNGALRGVCVGYVTKDKNLIKQYFTRRAIIIGGPLLAQGITDSELMSLLLHTKSQLKNAIYVETRNFNDYSKWKNVFLKTGFQYHAHYNFKVDCSSEEIMMKNMDRGRKRNINSSIEAGCEMIENPTMEQVIEWYAILKDLYTSKVKTPLFPLSFFKILYEQKDCKYFLIKYKEKVIGGTACVVEDGKAIYEWYGCGKDGEIKGVAPSVLSTYQGMKYAEEHSIPILDMMGAGSPNEDYGVRKFKERFGGKLVEHGRFICITKPILYKIGVLGVKIITYSQKK